MSIANDINNFDLKSIDLKDPRTQTLLLSMLAALIAVALYIYFIFVPQVVRVFKLTVGAGKMKSELRGARTTIMDLDKLKKDLEERSLKVDSYENKLPAEQEIPALLESLSNMVRVVSVRGLKRVCHPAPGPFASFPPRSPVMIRSWPAQSFFTAIRMNPAAFISAVAAVAWSSPISSNNQPPSARA